MVTLLPVGGLLCLHTVSLRGKQKLGSGLFDSKPGRRKRERESLSTHKKKARSQKGSSSKEIREGDE
jgi:hypothetical protein